MNIEMYAYGALLVLVALLLLIIPMLRHRSQPGVTLSLSALIISFPVAIVLIYLGNSSYDWEAANNPTTTESPDVDAMVERLAARMNAEPDLEGLTMLARSYAQLGQFNNAADTWHKAWVMTEGNDPQVSLSYAEALILADQRTLRTAAGDLLEQVLLQLPDDPRALWYGGLSAAARGDKETAAQRWSKLLQADLPDNMRMVVQQQLASLTLEDVPAGQQAAAEQPTVITVNVLLAPELQARVNRDGSARLFIIARDQNQPMPPVAVKRVRLGDFPVSIDISDTDAMMSGKKLASIANLQILTRISQSGEAFAAPGDLFGEALPQTDDQGSRSATVIINQVVE